MSGFFLGIDTSNYTTSIAVCDANSDITVDERIVLSVEKGNRGLRQSDALFMHIKNLPKLFRKTDFNFTYLSAIGVSTAPRRAEGSYMPVFLAGSEAAHILARTLNIPIYEFSHQEGHIRAGIMSCGECFQDDFYAVHISGGTTEILNVKKKCKRFDCEITGATLDISAGQLIDRIGVKTGLSFPSGKLLEEISADETDIKLPVCVKDTNIHFSGTETHTLKLIESGAAKEEIARAVFSAVSRSLIGALQNVFKQFGSKQILFVGGVASNRFIKEDIKNVFGEKALFCLPKYSTDNAVGTALMTSDLFCD